MKEKIIYKKRFKEEDKDLIKIKKNVFGFVGDGARSAKLNWEEVVDAIEDIASLFKINPNKIIHEYEKEKDEDGDLLESIEVFYKNKSITGLLDLEKGRCNITPRNIDSWYNFLKKNK